MTTFFCPSCWETVEPDAKTCPHCHSDLSRFDQRELGAKLIGALRHPEPMTRQRAAFLLGERHERAAVAALGDLLRSSTEPFLVSEIATALGKIGGEEAKQLLAGALEHPAFVVREAALLALARLGGPTAAAALEHAAADPSPSVRRLARELRAQTVCK
jgi:hypothetical protein